MKRRVDPDSPQSSVTGPVTASGTGETENPRPGTASTDAPRAARHRAVASMSWEVSVHSTNVGADDAAAQTRARWATDLLEGARTPPWSGPGPTTRSTAQPPMPRRTTAA